MKPSIVRKAWAVAPPAAACALLALLAPLLAGCDWFAGGVDSSGGADSGSVGSGGPAPEGGSGGFDAGPPPDGAPSAEAAADAEAGAATDGAVDGSTEAGDAGTDGADAACATCVYGCFAGACTGQLTSLGGTAAALTSSGAAVTIVQTTPNGTSTSGGPVSHTDSVTVTTTTQPGGAYLTVTVTWGFDPTMATFNPVPMTLKSTTQSADTWTGVIPAQAAGSEVYFYVNAKPSVGATAFDPTGFVHYAYAVN